MYGVYGVCIRTYALWHFSSRAAVHRAGSYGRWAADGLPVPGQHGTDGGGRCVSRQRSENRSYGGRIGVLPQDRGAVGRSRAAPVERLGAESDWVVAAVSTQQRSQRLSSSSPATLAHQCSSLAPASLQHRSSIAPASLQQRAALLNQCGSRRPTIDPDKSRSSRLEPGGRSGCWWIAEGRDATVLLPLPWTLPNTTACGLWSVGWCRLLHRVGVTVLPRPARPRSNTRT